jgi:hypothetical protein
MNDEHGTVFGRLPVLLFLGFNLHLFHKHLLPSVRVNANFREVRVVALGVQEFLARFGPPYELLLSRSDLIIASPYVQALKMNTSASLLQPIMI